MAINSSESNPPTIQLVAFVNHDFVIQFWIFSSDLAGNALGILPQDWDSGSVTTDSFIPEAKFMVPVNGGELALYRYGAAGGKPVLLLHGITSSNRAWPFFAKELIARGFTPFAPDLRGRGESNKIEGPFGMPAHAHDMAEVIDYLGFEKMDIIGHSMGAFVGVALTGIYPEKVSKLVFIDGGVLFPLPEGFTVEQITPLILGQALARLSMKFESTQAYRDFWKTNPALGNVWSPELDEYSDYDLQGTPPNLHPRTSINAAHRAGRWRESTHCACCRCRQLPDHGDGQERDFRIGDR